MVDIFGSPLQGVEVVASKFDSGHLESPNSFDNNQLIETNIPLTSTHTIFLPFLTKSLVAITDQNGFYTIGALPPGTYQLYISPRSYDFTPLDRIITLNTNIIDKDFILVNMIRIPEGEFKMGCDQDNSEELCDPDEIPLHTVYLDEYYVDKYEGTWGQYIECEKDGICPILSDEPSWSNNYHLPIFYSRPIQNIQWGQAELFCEWAGKRLLTEAEWEKSARGSMDTRIWPWGNTYPTCDYANLAVNPDGDPECILGFTVVGTYPLGASPYGLLDMAGNVYEWVSDWYSMDYYQTSPENNPTGPASGPDQKVLRGGGYMGSGNDPGLGRIAARSSNAYWCPTNWIHGVRCAAPIR